VHTRATVSRDWYTSERIQRNGSARQSSVVDPRGSEGPESTPKPGGQTNGAPARKPAAPLNLANSPMLHLLRPDEQALCSTLRILPKPYLVIKETLVREYARRGGKLRRREARDLVKIDVNKTSRVWDFLVQTGFLKIAPDLTANVNAQASANPNTTNAGQPSGSQVVKNSPRPPNLTVPSISASTSSSLTVPPSSTPSTSIQSMQTPPPRQ